MPHRARRSRSLLLLAALAAGVDVARADEPAPPAGALRGPNVAARVIEGVPPVHPDGAAGRPLQVRVLVHLDAEGRVEDLHFEDDVPVRFREAATAAVAASSFAPALRDGVAVPGDLLLDVLFEPPPPDEDEGEVIEVVGVTDRRPVRGASDLRIAVRDAAAVPATSAADMLKLAPGMMVTALGSEAHPPAIFLRGFDARHGQDIAFSVDGLPLNQVGNPHGHGLVDLHAVIPEAVSTLRVQEGPFDPAQRDFTVAGSAGFDLDLPDPGFLLRATYGSWNTARGVVGWRDAKHPGTFVLGEVFHTDGYGQNRGALRGAAMARVEGSGVVDWHVLAGGYGAQWSSAGLVRQVDVDAGRVDRLGTQDAAQGGTSQLGYVTAGLGQDDGETAWTVDLGGSFRAMSLRDDYTGFLLDDRRPGESPHGQRGDLLEQSTKGFMLYLDGRARRAWVGEGIVSGAVAGGVFARVDDVDGAARRLRAVDLRAYRTEADLGLVQGDVAAWAEGELVLADVFTLRAGARLQSFLYRLDDHCPAKDTWFPGVVADTTNCPTVDRNGAIVGEQIRTAQGLGVAPRGSLALKLPEGNSLLGGWGRGLRSTEARALSSGETAPFGDLWGGEVGWEHKAAGDFWTTVHRVSGFTTHVQRDLVFDEVEGANVYGGSTSRYGASLESDAHVLGFHERTTATYTYAAFGKDIPPRYSDYNSDRQPGKLVPYVPPVVVRSDLSYGVTAKGVEVRPGIVLTYLAPRPLPQSQHSRYVLTLDVAAGVKWRGLEVGLAVTNVTNARYNLAEYNYSSWFPATSGAAFPTRVPTRQVSPGAPIGVMATVTIRPGLF